MTRTPPSRRRGRKLLLAGARTMGRSVLRALPGVNSQSQWRKIGEDWFATLSELKGAAMKLGQIASQYRDLLPDTLAEQLARLQRSAEPLPFDQIRPILDSQWSPAQRKLVRDIDETALASASIGQVHRATLRDGRKAVIKVRYPGVAEAVDADLANLARLIRMASKLPVDKAGLKALLAEIRNRFVEETDYENERRNLELFRSAPVEGIHFPEPIPELCGPGILAMTEVPADDSEAAKHYPQDVRNLIGRRLLQWLNQQLFTTGRLHADPHPGNFSFRPNGDIVVYDFGCMKKLRPAERAGMRAVLKASLVQDWAGVHAGLLRLGVVAQPFDGKHREVFAKLYADHAQAIQDPILAVELFDFADGTILDRARQAAQRAIPHWPKFRVAAELAFVMRTLSGMYWLLRGLRAQAPLRAVVRQVAAADR